MKLKLILLGLEFYVSGLVVFAVELGRNDMFDYFVIDFYFNI